MNTLLTHSVWTREERLEALPGITHSELCSHARALLDRHALEASFYYGNVDKATVTFSCPETQLTQCTAYLGNSNSVDEKRN